MNRRERLEVLGDKMKRFNNVYVKNFSEEIDDEKLRDMFEPYGKIISAKVQTYFWLNTQLNTLCQFSEVCKKHVFSLLRHECLENYCHQGEGNHNVV